MRAKSRLLVLLGLALLPATGCWSSVGARLHFNIDQHAHPGFSTMFYSELGLSSESCPLNRRGQETNHWVGYPVDFLWLRGETTLLTASARYRVLIPVGEVRSSDGNSAPIDLMMNARAGFGGTLDSDVPNLATVGAGVGLRYPLSSLGRWGVVPQVRLDYYESFSDFRWIVPGVGVGGDYNTSICHWPPW